MPADSNEESRDRRAGRKIEHECLRLIMENKSATPRSKKPTEPTHAAERHRKLKEAEEELYAYARTYFERHPWSQPIVLVAAAGEWWEWAVVTAEIFDPKEPEDLTRAVYSATYSLCTGDSDQAWSNIFHTYLNVNHPAVQVNPEQPESDDEDMEVDDE